MNRDPVAYLKTPEGQRVREQAKQLAAEQAGILSPSEIDYARRRMPVVNIDLAIAIDRIPEADKNWLLLEMMKYQLGENDHAALADLQSDLGGLIEIARGERLSNKQLARSRK